MYYYRGNIEAGTESLTQRKSLDKIDQACRAVEKVNNYLDYHRDKIKKPSNLYGTDKKISPPRVGTKNERF